MNLHEFKRDHKEVFDEAVSDIDWDKVEKFLDGIDGELGEYLYDHFETYYETTDEYQNQAAYESHVDSQIDDALQKKADALFGDIVEIMKPL